MRGNVTDGGWEPAGWGPVLWEGAPWRFAAVLKGAASGDVTGGALFANGVEYPVTAAKGLISFEVPVGEVARIPNRAPCSLYVDTTAGRFLWLNGSVTKGDAAHA